MKTLILSIVVFFWVYISNAQNVNIPDTAFLYALIDEGVDINGDSLISIEEAKAVNYLNIIGSDTDYGGWCIENGGIVSLDGIEAFTNLDSLICSCNSIVNLNLTNNVTLTYLECFGNHLTSLNVYNNTALTYLECFGNQLTSLDVSGCTALTDLECQHNQLTSLDVSNNTALEELYCWENQLTSLNVSNNTALTKLWSQRNLLISLDVSDVTALSELWCWDNQLSSLDISNNLALTSLLCDYNLLTSLNVSSNTNLEGLGCSGNQLTSLDVSNNTNLEHLYSSDMPTLHEVCVWEIPFPPAGVEVDTTGSPNVSFTTDCSITDLNVYTKNSTVKIYPNPSDDIINIKIENPNSATIKIFNVRGNLLNSIRTDSKTKKIDVSAYSTGIYFVKVIQDNKIYFEKVVVL